MFLYFSISNWTLGVLFMLTSLFKKIYELCTLQTASLKRLFSAWGHCTAHLAHVLPVEYFTYVVSCFNQLVQVHPSLYLQPIEHIHHVLCGHVPRGTTGIGTAPEARHWGIHYTHAHLGTQRCKVYLCCIFHVGIKFPSIKCFLYCHNEQESRVMSTTIDLN